MAIFLDRAAGTRQVLKPYHVFGRSPGHSDCVLATPDISMIHACVRWDDEQWTLTDQSRNGSFINGRRLVKDFLTRMSVGDEVCFGSLGGRAWRVEDLSSPADLLFPVSPGLKMISLGAFQNLPDDAAPEACLYRGSDGQWLKESLDGVAPVGNGDLVCVGPNVWRLMCALPEPSTVVPCGAFSCMKFETSLDEEHVYLRVTRGRSTLDLGERTHHYLLMLLARQRLLDVARALDPHAQGWTEFDDLVRLAGLDKAHLNIQIFRLRKQLEQVVSQGLIQHDFIERRRGGVRLGNVALEIWKGSALEGRWQPDPVTRV